MPENDGMRRRLGVLFDGAGWSLGLAAAFFLFALISGIAEAESTSVVLWTGQHVVAPESHGIAYFRYHGRSYAVDVPGYGSAPAVDVYFDPGDPANAMADNAASRAVTGLLVGGPAFAGLVVLSIGLTRRWRWRRRQARSRDQFGAGLDDDFVARQLQARRGSAAPGG
jgi:hypothetical protein